MKKYLGTFLSGVAAGICIALGGTVFLKVRDAFPGGSVVGAMLFAIGLFVICTRGYLLFTGKVCYLPFQKPSYLLSLLVIWVGNFCGCALVAALEWAAGLAGGEAGLYATARALVESKMTNAWWALFVLGILCNICIFIAVDGYKNNPHALGKYLSLFLGVMVFILIGSEHCVADMYYWCVSGVFLAQPGASLARLLVITLGNALGGVLLPLGEAAIRRLKTAV